VGDAAQIIQAAGTGDGMGWGEHNSDVHVGCERFFRPTYAAHLVNGWIPELDGVVDKLTAGAAVADVGCGHGASTILMAEAFPGSTFRGTDYHAGSIATAHERAQQI
jgi:2-polyprenyl-3-methyl-5-hydroxy-6-metoxy-1,4-benzoquinol methylase